MKFKLKNLLRDDAILNAGYEFVYLYKTPTNLNYFFNFGFLSLMCLIVQIVTGLILSMHYVPE